MSRAAAGRPRAPEHPPDVMSKGDWTGAVQRKPSSVGCSWAVQLSDKGSSFDQEMVPHASQVIASVLGLMGCFGAVATMAMPKAGKTNLPGRGALSWGG